MGNGYASETIAAVINHFREKDAKSVKMQVSRNNAIALHVYEKCGFKVTGPVPRNNEFVFVEKVLEQF